MKRILEISFILSDECKGELKNFERLCHEPGLERGRLVHGSPVLERRYAVWRVVAGVA